MIQKYIYILIIFSVTRGFLANYFESLKYLWDIIIIIGNIFLFFPFINILNKNKKILILYVIFILSFITSSLNSLNYGANLIVGDILQFIYINNIWIIIVCTMKAKHIDIRKIWNLLMVLMTIQLAFDLFNYFDVNMNVNDELDRFRGSMFMANQKARMLGVFILYMINIIKFKKIKVNLFTWLNLIFILISFMLGFSNLTYGVLIISFLISVIYYCIKNILKMRFDKFLGKYVITIIVFILVTFFVANKFIISNPKLESMITIYSARFLDNDTGVNSVINYSLKTSINNIGVGTGGGSFMGRANSFVNSPISNNRPRTMVVYGELDESSTVDGVSSLINILVEYGILGVVSFTLLMFELFKFNRIKDNIVNSSIDIYMLFIIAYTPYFFDNEMGILMIFSYIIYKRLIMNDKILDKEI